jgi:HSP20 family protein
MRNLLKVFLLSAVLGSSTLAWGISEVDYLDSMINHHKESLERMKSLSDKEINKEIKELNEDMIKTEEKELKQISKLRKKLFSDRKVSVIDEFSLLRKEFDEEIQRLQNETSKLFGRYGQGFKTGLSAASDVPRIEIKDNKDAYEIRAEIPGAVSDNINVKLVNQDLVIKGERKSEVKKMDEQSSISEFSYGEFQRSIYLKDKVDPASLKTTYKDGILNVHLNKMKGWKGHRA